MFPATGSISDSLSIMPHKSGRRPSMRRSSMAVSAGMIQAGWIGHLLLGIACSIDRDKYIVQLCKH